MSEINTAGNTWRKIEEFLLEQVAHARGVTESSTSSLEAIRVNQGRLELAKQLLDLPNHREIEIKLKS